MHIWTIENWKHNYNGFCKSGLNVRYEKEINCEVKSHCCDFIKWVKSEYFFPVRVNIYIKSARNIKSLDNENVSATIFLPSDKFETPYIKISAGEYEDCSLKHGRSNALASILISLSHELTHYFQWINDIHLTEIGMERQATRYSKFVVYEYYQASK